MKNKIYVFILFSFFSTSVFSLSLEPSSWARSVLNSGTLKKLAFPQKVALISNLSVEKGLDIVDLDYDAFKKLSYIQFVTGESLSWSLKINQLRKDETNELAIVAHMMSVSGVNTLIYVPQNNQGEWRIYAMNHQKVELLVSSAATESLLSERFILNWFMDHLGYEGVVLDYQDPYVLIASRSSYWKKDMQGFLFDESHDAFMLKKGDLQGKAIIQLTEFKGHYAIFKVIMANAIAPRAGDKLILALER